MDIGEAEKMSNDSDLIQKKKPNDSDLTQITEEEKPLDKSPISVRIVCSFFKLQKTIVIGCRGQNIKKCDFDPPQLDLIISALISLVKGSKSKTINLAIEGKKLKMEISNGCLHFFSHTFPSDIKKIVQKK